MNCERCGEVVHPNVPCSYVSDYGNTNVPVRPPSNTSDVIDRTVCYRPAAWDEPAVTLALTSLGGPRFLVNVPDELSLVEAEDLLAALETAVWEARRKP